MGGSWWVRLLESVGVAAFVAAAKFVVTSWGSRGTN